MARKEGHTGAGNVLFFTSVYIQLCFSINHRVLLYLGGHGCVCVVFHNKEDRNVVAHASEDHLRIT